MGKYDDLLPLPHPEPKTRLRMPLSDRAAQFAPFAALTGYDAAIRETARLTEERAELDENARELLNAKLLLLSEHLSERPFAEFTVFREDGRKSGGAYETVSGIVRRIDPTSRRVIFEGGGEIGIDGIQDIRGDLFENL